MFLAPIKQAVASTLPPIHVIGCQLEEIAEIERHLGLGLPLAYKEFLLWMGKDGGPIMIGSSCFCNEILLIQEGARELLIENGFPTSLPEDALVVWMHQGYQFAFVATSDGDDPPVYYYSETQEQRDFKAIYAHFSEFLTVNIEASLQSWREHPDWYPDFGRS